MSLPPKPEPKPRPTVAGTRACRKAGEVTRIRVAQVDVEGNESEKSFFGFVLADWTHPVISEVTIDGKAVTELITAKSSVVVAGKAVDDVSPWNKITVRVRFGTTTMSVDLDEEGRFSQTVPLVEGPNTVTLVAIDEGGNVSPATALEIVRTVVPPVEIPEPAEGVVKDISEKIGQVIQIREKGILLVRVQTERAIIVEFEEVQPVKKISVTMSAPARAVSVHVQQLPQKPAPLPEPTVSVPSVVVSYYLEISVAPTAVQPIMRPSKIHPVQVENAVIEFKVSKNWLKVNDVDPKSVKLLRYTWEWVELSTNAIGEDAAYNYYSALTPGFATFAVVGESVAPFNLTLILGISIVVIVAALIGFLVGRRH